MCQLRSSVTGNRPTTWLVAGSMRTTAPPGSTTQTDPAPSVRSQQTSPGSIVATTRPLPGSIRYTRDDDGVPYAPTHSASDVAITVAMPGPGDSLDCTAPEPGSIFTSVPAWYEMAHTALPWIAMPTISRPPASMTWRTRGPLDGAGVGVGPAAGAVQAVSSRTTRATGRRRADMATR